MNTSEYFKSGYKKGVKASIEGLLRCILEGADKETIKFIKQIVNSYE